MDYSNITKLDLSKKGLEELSDLSIYYNLIELNCSHNNLTNLYNLPQTLKKLYCVNNLITQIDNLPVTLKELECKNNPLKYEFEPTLENIRNYNNQNNQNK